MYICLIYCSVLFSAVDGTSATLDEYIACDQAVLWLNYIPYSKFVYMISLTLRYVGQHMYL